MTSCIGALVIHEETPMEIEATFTLSNGSEYTNVTSEFPSLEAFQVQMEKFVGQPAGSLTWHEPGGAKKVMAAPHIVAVTFAPTGAR